MTEMASLFPKVGGAAGPQGGGLVSPPGTVSPRNPDTGPDSAPLQKPALETVRSSLRLLNASAYRLQSECRKTVPPEPGAAVDYQLLTQQVIQCAYDIAKAAKQLVTITTREKKQ